MERAGGAVRRGGVTGDILRDPQAQAPRWLDRLVSGPGAAPPGLSLSFTGDALHVDMTRLQEGDRIAVSDTLRRAFGHLQVSGLWDAGGSRWRSCRPTPHRTNWWPR